MILGESGEIQIISVGRGGGGEEKDTLSLGIIFEEHNDQAKLFFCWFHDPSLWHSSSLIHSQHNRGTMPMTMRLALSCEREEGGA